MTIALIDGDIILYHISGGTKDEGHALKKFHRIVKEIRDTVFATDYLVAIKGSGNYRMDIYPDYKGHRSPIINKWNLFVKPVREALVANPPENYVIADGRESDDLLRIWAEQARIAGDHYIICSIDKDLRCIPGKHYNIKKKKIDNVSEDEADSFYWEQVLMGDSTDNIPGLPNIGKVKAKKILSTCTTSEERKIEVITKYKEIYGKDWHNYLLANGKLIHIQRHPNDYFSIDKTKYQ